MTTITTKVVWAESTTAVPPIKRTDQALMAHCYGGIQEVRDLSAALEDLGYRVGRDPQPDKLQHEVLSHFYNQLHAHGKDTSEVAVLLLPEVAGYATPRYTVLHVVEGVAVSLGSVWGPVPDLVSPGIRHILASELLRQLEENYT